MASRKADHSPAVAAPEADWVARNQFLDAIAQEIRRPLDGVLAVTDLLQRQPLSTDAQAYVRTIVEQHETLLQTLADACDLTRAEIGALEVELRPAELRTLMDGIQEAWAGRAAQAGVSLSVAYDGDELLAMVDAPRIRQMFNNLIDRALRLTRRGGVEAVLRARRGHAGLIIEGSVRDAGPVLSDERLARLFDTETGLNAASEGGMGVALCRHVVKAMDGQILAHNNPGAGVTITFGFVAAETEHVSENRIEDQHTNRTAHVLVVDDNATNRMVAEALCEMFDCTSECAEDGVEAVEAAKSGRFDLILMDIKMPRMDGVEATRTIRAMPGRAGAVPIIALTANADPDDAKGYLASGMSNVVEKPIKPEALLAAMNACLPETGEAGHAAAA